MPAIRVVALVALLCAAGATDAQPPPRARALGVSASVRQAADLASESLREETMRMKPGDGSAPLGTTVSRYNSLECSALDPSAVIYNRIPKCGSTTMLKLIQQQQRTVESFTYVHSTDMRDHGSEKRQNYFKAIALASARTLYDRHQYFIAGVEGATWINLMRDPVARMTSSYYYSRYSAGLPIEQRQNNLRRWGSQSLDQCVARDRSKWGSCGVRTNVAVQFFCGTGHVCSQPSSVDAFRLAQRHIKRKYAVVGVVERLDDFLQLLERRLPSYFAGIGGIKAELAGQQSDKVHANSNPHPEASAETVERLRKANAADYALYEWISDRMDRQLKDCRRRSK